MKNDNGVSSMQRSFWQRRRFRFLVFAVALVAVLVFGGVFLFWLPSAEANFVSFVCSPSSGGQEFIINARANLVDGMDRSEAMEVASKVLSEIPQQAAGQILRLLSANFTCDGKGIWVVELCFGVTVHEGSVDRSSVHDLYDASRAYGGSEVLPHTLRTCMMAIDPFSQTVRYSG